MATKLLLIQDAKHLGRKGDVVSVKDGYARNWLIPTKIAVAANKGTLRTQARLQEERKQKALADKADAEAISGHVNGKIIKTEVKVDHAGQMYGSVSAADVARLLEEQHNVQIDKHAVQLKHAVKTTGTSLITLKLPEGVTAVVTLKVFAEGAEEQESASVEE